MQELLETQYRKDEIMAYTISIHHGGGKANRGHNIREAHAIKNQDHIDTTRPCEVWRDETEASAYKRLFGEATERYNASQPRKERRIRSYHAEVERNAKMHTSYECIVQIGNRDNHLDPETERAILERFYQEWEARNPNLELYGAYFHMDEEGGNHLHLDYIPVAHGYERGLDTQAGLVKALGEQGFVKRGKVTAQTMWQQRENQALESICREYGLEIEHPMRDNPEKQKQHMETQQYKATAQLEETLEAVEQNKRDAAYLQGRIEVKEQQEASLDKRITKKEKKLDSLEGSVKEAKQLKKERKPHFWSRDEITISYAEYQRLQKTARAVESVQEAQKQVETDRSELNYQQNQIQPDLDEIAREKKRLRQKEADIDRAIERRADQQTRQRIQEILQGSSDSYTQRLEDFVSQFKLKGENMLEVFQAQERELRKSLSRGWER